jgi:hypothetical protein
MPSSRYESVTFESFKRDDNLLHDSMPCLYHCIPYLFKKPSLHLPSFILLTNDSMRFMPLVFSLTSLILSIFANARCNLLKPNSLGYLSGLRNECTRCPWPLVLSTQWRTDGQLRQHTEQHTERPILSSSAWIGYNRPRPWFLVPARLSRGGRKAFSGKRQSLFRPGRGMHLDMLLVSRSRVFDFQA